MRLPRKSSRDKEITFQTPENTHYTDPKTRQVCTIPHKYVTMWKMWSSILARAQQNHGMRTLLYYDPQIETADWASQNWAHSKVRCDFSAKRDSDRPSADSEKSYPVDDFWYLLRDLAGMRPKVREAQSFVVVFVVVHTVPWNLELSEINWDLVTLLQQINTQYKISRNPQSLSLQ